jgi:hypothetical protein
MRLPKIFSAVVMVLTMFVGMSIAQTQWANTKVTLRSETVGRGGNFYLNTNSIGQDICIIFTLEPSSYNVVGQPDFTGTRITIPASSGSNDVYIGRFAAASNAAWNSYVTFSYRGGACVYSENQAAPVPNGLKLTNYHTIANLDYHNGFTVDAPTTLKTDGPQDSTTNQGKPFTETIYTGTLANDDTYMVAVSQYGFQVAQTDLALGLEAFRVSTNGTITKQDSSLTVSGQPALMAFVDSDVKGRTLRFALLITYKGNKAFIFAFGTWLDTTGTDLEAVKTFFKSAALN